VISFEVAGAGAQLRIIQNHADGSITSQLFDRNMITGLSAAPAAPKAAEDR
jgi:hypothetical protein